MARCKHDWWDVTRLGAGYTESICNKCGEHRRESFFSAPSASPIRPVWRSANGIEMREAVRRSGGGDPYKFSLTQDRSGLRAEYGCGCVWEIDERTLARVSGPLSPQSFETSCPTHRGVVALGIGVGPYDPSGAFPVVGIAQGGALAGGSLHVTLGSPGSPVYAAPEPPRELELMFDTEPIVGWRMWRVVTHHLHGGNTEPRLQPLTGRNLWEPRVRYAAVCLPPSTSFVYGNHGETHEAPGRHCDCGTWAVRDKADLPNVRSQDRGILCVGEVNLWGRVLEFKKGYRAKYAYPKTLTLLADDAQLADDLARLYGVEVALDPPRDPYRFDDATEAEKYAQYLMSAYKPFPTFTIDPVLYFPPSATGSEAAKVEREMKEADAEAKAILARAKKPVPPRPRPTFRDALRRR